MMASPDKKTQFPLESPDGTRPAGWSERIQKIGSPERARLAWSRSKTGSPEKTRSSWSTVQSKIENPEKTRSNWSRAIQSSDEQDHAVRIRHHSQNHHY